ncbi:hypothetical protein M422DRAFT_23697 [Sphaerobolus stellatus SS14]|nr:hypothetical protein M422DRAFT_23697 [Sphaerobolus stellatus SS14]
MQSKAPRQMQDKASNLFLLFVFNFVVFAAIFIAIFEVRSPMEIFALFLTIIGMGVIIFDQISNSSEQQEDIETWV